MIVWKLFSWHDWEEQKLLWNNSRMILACVFSFNSFFVPRKKNSRIVWRKIFTMKLLIMFPFINDVWRSFVVNYDVDGHFVSLNVLFWRVLLPSSHWDANEISSRPLRIFYWPNLAYMNVSFMTKTQSEGDEMEKCNQFFGRRKSINTL